MTLLDEQSTLPKSYAGESTATAIRVDGERVYVFNRGHDSIACLRVEGDTLIPGGFFPARARDREISTSLGIESSAPTETDDSVTVLDKQAGKLLSALRLLRPLCVTVLPPERR